MTLTKIKADYAAFIATKIGAVVNRVVVTGVVCFAATFMPQAIEVHLFTVPEFFNLSAWHVALGASLYAGGAAALVALQSVLSTLFSSVHAPQITPAGRAKFVARRAARA